MSGSGRDGAELLRLRERVGRLESENRYLTGLLGLLDPADDPAARLEHALKLVIEATGAARGMLGLFSADADSPAWWVARSVDGDELTPDAFSRTVMQRALREGRTILSTNLMDSRFGEARSIQRQALRQALCAPLGAGPVGVLYLQDCAGRKAAFDDSDRGAVDRFAALFEPVARSILRGLDAPPDPSADARARLVGHEPLIGRSPAFTDVLHEIHWANLFDDPPGPVMLLGPTGVGKSTIASVVHANSSVRDGPFVQFNCANLPADRLDERLFGVRDRAYSGVGRWVGLVEEADGGTLFLDEVGELSLASQAKLLTFLDTGAYRIAGDDSDSHATVRLVTATNRDPQALVASGAMRLDFHARISENEIHVPALHQRGDDVRLLARHLAEEAARGTSYDVTISPGALDALSARRWPTGVRGLRKEVRSALKNAVRAGSGEIGSEHLSAPDDGEETGDLRAARATAERDAILDALKQAEGNRSAAARLLGIGRQHLYRRMKTLEID